MPGWHLAHRICRATHGMLARLHGWLKEPSGVPALDLPAALLTFPVFWLACLAYRAGCYVHSRAMAGGVA